MIYKRSYLQNIYEIKVFIVYSQLYNRYKNIPVSQYAFGPKAYKCKPIDIDALRQLLQVRK